nr:patatin-like phospholipase family protein [uncultured Duganella sp.]
MTLPTQTQQRRVGLVLSGGGAKGAYQVGVLKALVENRIEVHAVAGASIGALNAAVLASSPSVAAGAERLEEVWNALARTPPLQHNLPGYLHLLLAAGMSVASGPFSSMLAKAASSVGTLLAGLDNNKQGLLSSEPLYNLMEKYFSSDAIRTGLPLYVSVYRSAGGLRDIANVTLAEFGLRDTAPSQFLHIQSLPPADQKEVLLASAALPVLFTAGKVNGNRYADGGMGGWSRSQGNTPVTPLLEAGITDLIVTHLSDGSLWSRHNFPEANILEIRPKTPLERDGGHSDLLGFQADKIASWIEQGYTDTQAAVHRLADVNTARVALRDSELRLESGQQKMAAMDADLEMAMRRIGGNS